MTDAHAVEIRTRTVIANLLDATPTGVQMDTHFVRDLATDSLDMIDLTMALEEEFDIELDDEDAQSIKIVADAVRIVTAQIAA